MEVFYLLLILGPFVGVPLAIAGVALSVRKKTRAFAVPVLVASIAGAGLAALTFEDAPAFSIFFAAFTVIAVILGVLAAIVAVTLAPRPE